MPHRVICKHNDYVTSIALGAIEGAPVVISGSWDKTLRRWDARTGEPIGEPLEGHTDLVSAVALGAIDGEPVIVSGSRDGTIRRWDAHGGERGQITIGDPVVSICTDNSTSVIVGLDRGIVLFEFLSMQQK